ncbi:MAG TPA: hypothetical protein VFB26_03740 [Gaiellaceae bacterium]|nr:hypothetical protein [Gaiellaceae bacterium]
MTVAVETDEGVAVVDLDDEEVIAFEPGGALERAPLDVGLPLVVDADRSGATIVAVVDRRPPLVISRDAGATWHEAGAGLPAGRSVAISPDHPDLVVFASENRLHVSRDGGRFWQALTVELDAIRRVAWLGDGPDLG